MIRLALLLGATAVLAVSLGGSARSAAQENAAPTEKKPAVARYVPVKMDAAEAKKQQADWAAKLQAKSETKTAMGISMVLIPPAGDAIPKPYWIGKYEVTQGEWQAVMDSNPSRFRDGKDPLVKGLVTSRHPVETVSWFESLYFCNRLSEKEGLKPYYAIKVVERRVENKQINKAEIEILGGDGYHLPTLEEWEHACRGGAATPFFFGDKETGIEDYGWLIKNSDNRTHSVGEKKPNAFGLHDTYGNVREWVQLFARDEKTKAIGQVACCGGSFHYYPFGGNGVRRHGAGEGLWFVGLRLAREANPEASKK